MMKIKNAKNKELNEYKKMSVLVDRVYREVKEIIKKQSKKERDSFCYFTT